MPHCKKNISEPTMGYEISDSHSRINQIDLIMDHSKNSQPFSLDVEITDASLSEDSVNIIRLTNSDIRKFETINSVIEMLISEDYIPKYSMLFLYNDESNCFSIIGLDPIKVVIPLSLSSLNNANEFQEVLRIKFKRAPEIVGRGKAKSKQNSGPPECLLKTKERNIFEVIELVLKWRKLNHGFWDGNVFRKYTLEQTAQFIGVPKKTLDDYMFQLKLGRIHKFNFEEKLNEKIGILRSFVKGKKNNSEQNLKFQRLDLDFFDYFEKLIPKLQINEPKENSDAKCLVFEKQEHFEENFISVKHEFQDMNDIKSPSGYEAPAQKDEKLFLSNPEPLYQYNEEPFSIKVEEFFEFGKYDYISFIDDSDDFMKDDNPVDRRMLQ